MYSALYDSWHVQLQLHQLTINNALYLCPGYQGNYIRAAIGFTFDLLAVSIHQRLEPKLTLSYISIWP